MHIFWFGTFIGLLTALSTTAGTAAALFTLLFALIGNSLLSWFGENRALDPVNAGDRPTDVDLSLAATAEQAEALLRAGQARMQAAADAEQNRIAAVQTRYDDRNRKVAALANTLALGAILGLFAGFGLRYFDQAVLVAGLEDTRIERIRRLADAYLKAGPATPVVGDEATRKAIVQEMAALLREIASQKPPSSVSIQDGEFRPLRDLAQSLRNIAHRQGDGPGSELEQATREALDQIVGKIYTIADEVESRVKDKATLPR